LANLDLGYSVVHPTRDWSSRIKWKTRDAADLRHALIMSDGLYRLVDVFCVADDRGLLKRALKDGLKRLCLEVRELELEDARCSTYPRIKICDDASAILLRVV
jgi:hypothetical protein